MTGELLEVGPPTMDDEVDASILQCLDPNAPKSFFLYAGAGSGKTRSLVSVLEAFKGRHGATFRKSGQKIAIITYTNAACDEITERVNADPLFVISTIHSFCWSQISSFHSDIRTWLQNILPDEIEELEQAQAKGRSGTQAALDREKGIQARQKRLEWLSAPRRFTYNPNGDNFGMASLSHSEVLRLTAHFIENKPSMGVILRNRYPLLLIDESQDTNKHLLAAFFALEAESKGSFALGLFGDMMQRIYADGMPKLGESIPESWVKPVKKMNHRCPRRIVQLGNKLRERIDDQRQVARDDREQGVIRLFVAPNNNPDKRATERLARERMAAFTDDPAWLSDGAAVKALTLEHHMAASRMGFAELFDAFNQDKSLRDSFLRGDLAGVRLFSERVAPVVTALAADDKFEVMAILRSNSPLLKKDYLRAADDPTDPLGAARRAIEALQQIDMSDANTTFMDVLRCVAEHDLFEIPDSLKPFIDDENGLASEADENEGNKSSPASLESWRAFLETPYKQIQPYAEYIADTGEFGTHQGVKGLQFDRVLVVIDDSEARGFMFSYEKLFGVKPLSDSDRKKQADGEEIGVDRTRRLLYVTCTRAQKSLALVAYTDNPNALIENATREGLFEPSEIERL